MLISRMALPALACLFLINFPSPVEAQGPPIVLSCDPMSGTYLVHVSFSDPGAFTHFDVTVDGVLTLVMASAGAGPVNVLVPVPGSGGHYICVSGVGGGVGSGSTGCCQFVVPPTIDFIRGDANADGAHDIADVVKLLGFSFGGTPLLCLDAADANDDGAVDVSDPIYLLMWFFSVGPAPPSPMPGCGPDPTLDLINCVSFPPCP